MAVPPTRSRPRRWVLVLLVVATTVALGVVVVLHRTASTSAAARAATRSPTPRSTVTSSPTATPSPTRTPAPTPTPTAKTSLRVVGLGDSVTSGEQCDCDDYVAGFGALLRKSEGVKVTTTNDGVSGSTSDELADDLKSDDGVRNDLSRADVVVVTMGANDLGPALDSWRSGGCDSSCTTPLVDTMGNDLDLALGRIDALTPPDVKVLVTTYWNVFIDGDLAKAQEGDAYLAWSDALTRKANTAICAAAAAHHDTCVDLYTPFKGDGSDDPTRLLESDGDHPDAAGTAAISEAVLEAYERDR